jgi:hypothetical protein
MAASYTSDMGQAGQDYLDELCRGRDGSFVVGPVWLPGTFRWEELFDRMLAAGGLEAVRAGRVEELLRANNADVERRRTLAIAAHNLRSRQRDYLANRTEANGRLVGEAAAELDVALEATWAPPGLFDAALALYLAGRWQCRELPPIEQARLWEELRDALGLLPGTATACEVGATNLCPYCADKPACECEPPLPFGDRPGAEL